MYFSDVEKYRYYRHIVPISAQESDCDVHLLPLLAFPLRSLPVWSHAEWQEPSLHSGTQNIRQSQRRISQGIFRYLIINLVINK